MSTPAPSASPVAPVQLRLLGPPALVLPDRSLPLLPDRPHGLLALLAALSLAPPLAAQPAVQTAAPPALPASAGEVQAGVPLLLNQRHIVDFRGTMLGQSPAERAAQARVLLRQVLGAGGASDRNRTCI